MKVVYKKEDILKRIDHTELRPTATREDFMRLFKEAEKNHVAAVCVPPNWVHEARCWVPDEVRVCTVIGFPLGYNTEVVKQFEMREAIKLGADEIDMVINIGGAVEPGPFRPDIKNEILGMRQAIKNLAIESRSWPKLMNGDRGEFRADDITLKVIVETCYLNEAQKIELCECVTKAGADYIKTSTGFGPGGATLEDVRLFRKHIGPNVKIKAAGGISTIEDAIRFIDAGADRIGSSKLVRLLAADERTEYEIEVV